MKRDSLESFARSAVDAVVPTAVFNELCAIHAEDMSALLDQLARHIAQGYRDGAWSFEDAGGAMNNLWAFLCSQKDFVIPPYFYGAYEAFDAGEYYHSGDTHDVSPEERYTKPLIEKILGGS